MNKILLRELVKEIFLRTHTDKRVSLSRLTVMKVKKLTSKEYDLSLPCTQISPMEGLDLTVRLKKRKNLNLYIKDGIIYGLIHHFAYLHTIPSKNLTHHLGKEQFTRANERRQRLDLRNAIFSNFISSMSNYVKSNGHKSKVYHLNDRSYLWQIITYLVFSTSVYKDISIFPTPKNYSIKNANKEKVFEFDLLQISSSMIQMNQEKKINQNRYMSISPSITLHINSNNRMYGRGICKKEVEYPNIDFHVKKKRSINDLLFGSTQVNKYTSNVIYQIVYNLSKWYTKIYKKDSNLVITQDTARANYSLVNENQRYEINFKSRRAKSMSKLKTGQYMVNSIIDKDTHKWNKLYLMNEDIAVTHRLQRALQFQTYLNQKYTIKRFSNSKYKIFQNLFIHTYLLPGQLSSIRSSSITNKRKLESFKQKNKLRRLNKDLSIYKKYETFNIGKIHHFVYTPLTEFGTSPYYNIDFIKTLKDEVKKPKRFSINHLDLNAYLSHPQKNLLAQYVDIHLLRGFLKFDIQSKTKDFRVLHSSSIFENRLNPVINHHINSIPTYYNLNYLGLSRPSVIDNQLVDQKDKNNTPSQSIKKGYEDFLDNGIFDIDIKKDFLPLLVAISSRYRHFFQHPKIPQLRPSGSLQRYFLPKDQLQSLLGIDVENSEKPQKKAQKRHLYGFQSTRLEKNQKKRLIVYKEEVNSKQEIRHLRIMQPKLESKYQSEILKKIIESIDLCEPLSINTSQNGKTNLPWLQTNILHMFSKQAYRNQFKISQNRLKDRTDFKKLLDQKRFLFPNNAIVMGDRKKIESIKNPHLYSQLPPNDSSYLLHLKVEKDINRRKMVSGALMEAKLAKTTLYRVSNIFSRHILFLSQLMCTVRTLSFHQNIGICIPGIDSSMSPYLYGFIADLRWNLSYLIRIYHLKELLFKKKTHELRTVYRKNQSSLSIYSELEIRSDHPVQRLKSLLSKKNCSFFVKDFNLYKDDLKNTYLNDPHRIKIFLISSYQNLFIILKTHLLLFRISSLVIATYYTYIRNIYKQYVGKKKHYSHTLSLRTISLSHRNHLYLRRSQRSQIVFATIRGLCKGLSRFQLYRRVKFLTYASWWVRQYTSQKSIGIDAKGKYSESILVPIYIKEWIEKFRVKKNTILIQTGQLVHFWSIDRNQPLPGFKYLALFSYLSYSSPTRIRIRMPQKINNKRLEEEVQDTINSYGREIITRNQKQTPEKYMKNPYDLFYMGHYGYYYIYYRALLRVKKNYLTNFDRIEKDFQKKNIYRSGGRSRSIDLSYEKTLYRKALFKSLLQASEQGYTQMVCVPYLSRKDLSFIALLIGLYPYKEHQIHDLKFLFSISSGSLNDQVFNGQIRRLANRQVF